jgi:hypothetical protein
METIILICGIYNLAFAIFHIAFWNLFKWNSELKKLSFPNGGIMQILNVQIIYYFLFVALICFIFPNELASTKLGNAFLLGCSFFWFIRTIQQFIFLRANTYFLHILTFLFIVGTILFFLPVILS